MAVIALLLMGIDAAHTADSPGLQLESKISLGDIRGRIDHLAIDLNRQRLFVAELGNDTIGVVDLQERRTIGTLANLQEPQGIGYVPSTDTLYVANARDGSVRLFQGPNLAAAGQIVLGKDADNVRVDDAAHRVFVGYGNGALAVIDANTQRKIADVPLKAHPESFQIHPATQQVFVNIPEAGQIAVVDGAINRQVATWGTGSLRANFPMALDESHRRVLTVFRHPAKMGVFDAQGGGLLTSIETCGDADDAFYDAKRDRVYVSCGEGFLQVFAKQGEHYADLGRVVTAPGARTSLFVPAIDRLLLAVRAGGGVPASIWVFRPQ